MKKPTLYFQILFFFLFFSYSAFAQTQKTTQTELFSNVERDSLQMWFYDRATVMGLKDDKREEFYNIVLYHTYKMRALEKKEKGYTPEEIRSKFEALITKQNTEVKAILDEKQYRYYLETYDKLLEDVYKRKDWN